MNITRSLDAALPYRSVLEATVHPLPLSGGNNTYWFRLVVDEGYDPAITDGPMAPSDLGLVAIDTTSVTSTVSRQYTTYDEAIAALNTALGEHYGVDGYGE